MAFSLMIFWHVTLFSYNMCHLAVCCKFHFSRNLLVVAQQVEAPINTGTNAPSNFDGPYKRVTMLLNWRNLGMVERDLKSLMHLCIPLNSYSYSHLYFLCDTRFNTP